jgi:hypothetical protein
VPRRVALSRAMPHHKDLAGRGKRSADLRIEGVVLRGALTFLTRLILVRKVMQVMMGVIGPDLVRRSSTGSRFDAIELRAVMIHDHDKNGRFQVATSRPAGGNVANQPLRNW